MEFLLSDALVLHQQYYSATAFRQPTGLIAFRRSFTKLSRSLSCRRSLCLSPATIRTVSAVRRNPSLIANSIQSDNGTHTIENFMTKKEDLITVKPSTSIDEVLEKLVECRTSGFPVINDDWTLVGVVSDYDLLALNSISGCELNDKSIFPEVDSTWKTFKQIQKLSSKKNGKTVGEMMTPSPLVVRETSNLEAAVRLLLETKYRRLPVVDAAGKLIGIITRENVVRALLQLKHPNAKRA